MLQWKLYNAIHMIIIFTSTVIIQTVQTKIMKIEKANGESLIKGKS